MQKPLLLVLLSLCGLSGAFGQVPTGNEDAEAKPLVKILIDQGQTFSKATKYDDAIKTFSEAVKKAQEIGDVIGEAESNDEMGRAYYLTGNYIKAKELYLNAVRLFHKASTESQEMKATGHVAQIEQSTGNSKEAREVFLKLIAYFKGRGDKKAAGTQLLNICFTEGSLRLFDDQLKHAAEAKEIESSLGDKSGEGTALNQTALAYRGMRRK